MGKPPLPGLSRRAVLTGMGLTGVSFAAGLPERAPAEHYEGMDLPRVAPPGYRHPEAVLDAPPLNPAWSYLTYGWNQFFAAENGSVFSTGSTTGLSCASGNASLFAPIHLPQGTLLREATFYCYNTSATTGLALSVTRLDPPNAGSSSVSSFSTPGAGSHVISFDPSFIGAIDNRTASYALAAYLQPPVDQFGLIACRLAWEGSLGMTLLSPQVRKLDTRVAGPLAGKIGAGGVKTLSLAPDVPAGAKAALVNLTITGTEATGYLGLYPAGTTWPGTSAINWFGVGLTLANNATVAVSPASEISIICGGPGTAKAHVIVDLLGYYR